MLLGASTAGEFCFRETGRNSTTPTNITGRNPKPLLTGADAISLAVTSHAVTEHAC
jgi:hypothetical protein